MNTTPETLWPEWKTIRPAAAGMTGTIYEIQRSVTDPAETAAVQIISIPQNPARTVALKKRGYDANKISQRYQKLTDRFIEVNQKLQTLNGHTNLVPCQELHRIQHDDGLGWDLILKTPLLAPLDQILPQYYDESFVIQLGLDVCSALAACQEIGILHGNLTPQSLFVADNGNIQLGNFGVAIIADKKQYSIFTPPEAVQGAKRTIQSDLFSLGIILYWLMNNRSVGQLELPLPTPSCGSSALLKIVQKAAAFYPQDRYTSAEAMKMDLEILLHTYADNFFSVWEPDLSDICFPGNADTDFTDVSTVQICEKA